MIRKFFMSILLLATVASCTTDDDLLNIANDDNAGRGVKIHFGVKSLRSGSETRAIFGTPKDGKRADFAFFDGDEFGIYCVDTKRCSSLSVCGGFFAREKVTEEDDYLDFESSVPDDFIEDGYKYIVYYPYSSVSRDELYTYLSYGCQSFGQVEENSNYYFSNPFEFKDGKQNSDITLNSISAAIQLDLSDIWGTVKSIALVNVDAQGKFYANIPCMFTSNGVVPDLDRAHKVSRISLSINKYYYYSDEKKFVITSYPTTTGNFVLMLTMAEGNVEEGRNILYSDIIPSKTLKAGKWTVVKCNNWTFTPPEFQYDYLDINTGEYHKNP